MSSDSYEEFSLLNENLEEWGLDVEIPVVRRFYAALDEQRQLSGIHWGKGDPELILVHGSAQNAHTFDTVALALGRPLVALDLPGHGHSDPSPYFGSAISSHADDLVCAIEQVSTRPLPIVGMSRGGLCSILAASRRPDLVAALVLIDITPRPESGETRHISQFVDGPRSFNSFEEILARTIEHNPTRSVSSLRRGVMHNAVERPDGTWVWRHQQHEPSKLAPPDAGSLWDAFGSLEMPVALVRGMGEGSVVDDDDEREVLTRQPDATIVHVEGAGHSIQGEQPTLLANVLEELCC